MPGGTSTEGAVAVAEPTAADLRPPGGWRRFWLRHPRLVDVLVAGGYLLYGGFGPLSGPALTGVAPATAPLVVSLVAVLVTAVALLARRRHPWPVLAVAWLAAAGSAVVAGGGPDAVGIALALYAVAVHRRPRTAWLGFAVSIVAGAALPLLQRALSADPMPIPFTLIDPISATALLVATLIGVNVGGRRRYVRALLDRAEQLARERDQQAQLAAAAERARIAREMHDVVAHSLSVMITLSAGAGAVVGKDPDRARESLTEIGGVGRRSLAEMRRVLGALGSEDGPGTAPHHPQPGLDDLDDLVGTFRSAGLPVTVQTHGAPPTAAAAQVAVFRVVQEALTNALRHAAHAREVRVELEHAAGTTITVTDDGRGPAHPSPGSGRGLIGMRERAALFGGTAEAGPRPGGGWRTRVTLPQAGEDG